MSKLSNQNNKKRSKMKLAIAPIQAYNDTKKGKQATFLCLLSFT